MEIPLKKLFGAQLNDVDKAQDQDYPLLHKKLKSIGKENVITLNANGVSYIGYSYAKQTIRKVLSNLITDQYSFYCICLRYDESDYEKVFDGLIYALNQKGYSTFLVSESFQQPQILGYLSSSDPRDSKKEISKKKKQRSVLEYILKQKEAFTNDIAEAVNLKLPYTNRILKNLEDNRLITRVKETSPSGGPIYMNKSVFV